MQVHWQIALNLGSIGSALQWPGEAVFLVSLAMFSAPAEDRDDA